MFAHFSKRHGLSQALMQLSRDVGSPAGRCEAISGIVHVGPLPAPLNDSLDGVLDPPPTSLLDRSPTLLQCVSETGGSETDSGGGGTETSTQTQEIPNTTTVPDYPDDPGDCRSDW